MSDDESGELEALLELLKADRHFDFTGYKRPSLSRRISRRMALVGCSTYAEYLDYLQVHPEEFPRLFDTVLINVTGFFRDATTWKRLTADVLPGLVASRDPSDSVRAWVAGCASGEEAYSLAIALAEALGPGRWPSRLKVYATDVDEEALAAARQAMYRRNQLEGVSEPLLERYFEPVGEAYAVRKELRRLVIFGRHDLVQDAPISHIDVLSCRNTLMYFNAETQARILRRFHFALNEAGILLLGRAEMLLGQDDLFAPVDLKGRVFVKRATDRVGEQLQAFVHDRAPLARALPREQQMVRAALDASPVAHAVVDAGGRLAVANERAAVLFGISDDHVGRPFSDLDVAYRPVELRSLLERASTSRTPVRVEHVAWTLPSGEPCHFDVEVAPLVVGDEELLGVCVTFVDVTRSRALRDELEQANRDLETAYEELQSTNEELETTNEELQSTNSELETMNEELRSTNEELHAMNDELRDRTAELDLVNSYLESILASVRGALVVLDEDFGVAVWNRGAEHLWGLRADEVRGRRFVDLDLGPVVSELAPALRDCMNGDRAAERVLDAAGPRGTPIRCRVNCSPLARPADGRRGIVVFVEELAG